MEKEYINFAIYVKRHIIDENNNYRVEYYTMHSNIDKSYKGSFEDYFKESSILKEMGVTGKYDICLDMNQHIHVSQTCGIVRILEDADLINSTNDRPYKSMNANVTRYIHIAPEEEKWMKYVELDEKQIEQAKKLMSDIEERPFTKKRKLND